MRPVLTRAALRSLFWTAPLAVGVLGFGPCSGGGAASGGDADAGGAGLAAGGGHGAPERRRTAAEDAAIVDLAMAEHRKGEGADCRKVIAGLTTGLPDEVSAASEPAFLALAECAQRERRWSLLKQAVVRITRFDPAFDHPAMLPAAEIGTGEYIRAQSTLANLLPKYPKDPELVFQKAVIPCRQVQWLPCLAAMDDAIKLARSLPAGEPSRRLEASAGVRRADALLHTGKVDEAEAALAAADKLGAAKDDVAALKRKLAAAKAAKVVVDAFHQSEIPLGVYHLYGKAKDAGVPAQIALTNIGTKDRELRVDAEIVGLTKVFSNTVTVLKGLAEIVPVVPPLAAGGDAGATRAETTAPLHVKITAIDPPPAGEKVVYESSDPVVILPREALVLSVRVDEGAVKPLDDYVGAWVTPTAPPVAALVDAAKRRAPKVTFAGPQAPSVPQVGAIYDELAARGASFVMDAAVAGDSGQPQTTRLPAPVLATNAGSAVEGAIVFASAIEALGLEAFIVRVPGHAFVGWHSAKDNVPDGNRQYLETTMVHTASFADAMKYARAEFDAQTGRHQFEQGVSRIVEIRTLRGKGFAPQPSE
jgi:hypothetical protein